jgi:uncharacterized membrane protein YeiH
VVAAWPLAPTKGRNYAVRVESGDIVGILDRVGIVAFALSGVEIGARRRLDVFGLMVMGIVTATGGGLMRDLILVRVPFVIDRPDYLLLAAGASFVAILLIWRDRRMPRGIVSVADAAGLGAFAAAGALAAIRTELALPAVILLAVLTATGGGVVRDLLADRVPLVLRSEVNATAAALGGFALWLAEPVSTGGAALLAVAVTAMVRVAGLAFNLHLPHPGSDEGKQQRLL